MGKKKTRVEFGRLEGDKCYELPIKSRVPNFKYHLQNSLILSMAAYEQHAYEFLNDCSPSHSIHTICGETIYSDQRVVLAIGNVEGEDTLYVAFRGTSTWADVRDDIDSELKKCNVIPGG